jgi:hypothetical protein
MKFLNRDIPQRLFELTRDHINALASFTTDELRQHILTAGKADLAACNDLAQNWRLIAERVLRKVLGEMEDAKQVDHIKRGVWVRVTKLTRGEAAVICSIHQKPDYRFVGPELRLARRLATAEYLKEGVDNQFTVTPAGELAYSRAAAN